MPIRTIGRRLKGRPFVEESTEGFVIDRVRDDYLEARYIERLVFTEHVLDPFGNELSFDRLEFRNMEFRAWSGWPGLELVDAPRSAQNLVSRLSEATDFATAIVPLKLDVLNWASSLQKEIGVEAVVDSLQIGSLQLSAGITGKAVVKGERDVRNTVIKLVQGRKHRIEKVHLRFVGTVRAQVTLSDSGSARLETSESQDVLVEALRRSLSVARNT